ncbi:Conserved_hypothetical protein [Hexamita inflata]|uniref:Uncharacterized protein n=1 Tax=Hexamita inflata TaxID=28002 RepID=A0AA86P0I7_9EUKA|nr:Conserved hypothetical protein [Hexamita inflata]
MDKLLEIQDLEVLQSFFTNKLQQAIQTDSYFIINQVLVNIQRALHQFQKTQSKYQAPFCRQLFHQLKIDNYCIVCLKYIDPRNSKQSKLQCPICSSVCFCSGYCSLESGSHPCDFINKIKVKSMLLDPEIQQVRLDSQQLVKKALDLKQQIINVASSAQLTVKLPQLKDLDSQAELLIKESASYFALSVQPIYRSILHNKELLKVPVHAQEIVSDDKTDPFIFPYFMRICEILSNGMKQIKTNTHDFKLQSAYYQQQTAQLLVTQSNVLSAFNEFRALQKKIIMSLQLTDLRQLIFRLDDLQTELQKSERELQIPNFFDKLKNILVNEFKTKLLKSHFQNTLQIERTNNNIQEEATQIQILNEDQVNYETETQNLQNRVQYSQNKKKNLTDRLTHLEKINQNPTNKQLVQQIINQYKSGAEIEQLLSQAQTSIELNKQQMQEYSNTLENLQDSTKQKKLSQKLTKNRLDIKQKSINSQLTDKSYKMSLNLSSKTNTQLNYEQFQNSNSDFSQNNAQNEQFSPLIKITNKFGPQHQSKEFEQKFNKLQNSQVSPQITKPEIENTRDIIIENMTKYEQKIIPKNITNVLNIPNLPTRNRPSYARSVVFYRQQQNIPEEFQQYKAEIEEQDSFEIGSDFKMSLKIDRSITGLNSELFKKSHDIRQKIKVQQMEADDLITVRAKSINRKQKPEFKQICLDTLKLRPHFQKFTRMSAEAFTKHQIQKWRLFSSSVLVKQDDNQILVRKAIKQLKQQYVNNNYYFSIRKQIAFNKFNYACKNSQQQIIDLDLLKSQLDELQIQRVEFVKRNAIKFEQLNENMKQRLYKQLLNFVETGKEMKEFLGVTE